VNRDAAALLEPDFVVTIVSKEKSTTESAHIAFELAFIGMDWGLHEMVFSAGMCSPETLAIGIWSSRTRVR
jgi:hypothetical protein